MQICDQNMPEIQTSSEQSSTPAVSSDSQEHSTSASIARRREKPQLSCNACRKRKVRCDRLRPCNNCSSRGLGQSCVYSTKAPSARPHGRGHLQDRINQLEHTIVSLIKGNQENTSASLPDSGLAVPAQSVSPHQVNQQDLSSDSSGPKETPNKSCESRIVSEKESTTPENGSIKVRESEVTYASNAHWAAVLDSIAELRNELSNDDDAALVAGGSFQSHDNACPRLFYGGDPQATSLVSILDCLPPRIVVDRSVSRFFNTLDSTAGIIHSGKFLREYDEFWRTPKSAQPVWLGVLFAILCLSAQFQQFYVAPVSKSLYCEGRSPRLVEEPESQALIDLYQQKTVQCLIMSRYTKSRPYVIEALALYMMTELFTSKEIDTRMRLLVASIFQIGVNMGFHRDGSHFPNISPFEGEMRRRIWALIIQMDLGISKMVGLPRVVRHDQTDVAEPLNLFDSDFDEDSSELPPSRPETEFTPSLYTRVRLRLARSVGIRVTDIATLPRPPPYTDILTINSHIDLARSEIPLSLKWRGLSNSLIVQPRMLIKQIFLETTMFSMKILLHKRFMVASRSHSQYEFSLSMCVDAAIEILKLQNLIDEETQLEGRLYQARWSITTTFLHDFLLATGVLCFYLQTFGRGDHTQRDDGPEDSGPKVAGLDRVKDILRATLAIWVRESGTSKEARTAATAIRYILSNRHSHVQSDQSLAEIAPDYLSQIERGANIGDFFEFTPLGYGITGPTLEASMESTEFSWEHLQFNSNDLNATTGIGNCGSMDTS